MEPDTHPADTLRVRGAAQGADCLGGTVSRWLGDTRPSPLLPSSRPSGPDWARHALA